MPARITKFLHSRHAMLLAAALMILAAWSVNAAGSLVRIAGNRGTALPSANCWVADADVSMWLGIAANIAVIGLMVLVNRRYNLLRNLSMLFAALYAIMQAAIPDLTGQFYTGPLLAAVVMTCISLMFGCYARPWKRRRVFMVFFLLSAGAATQYSFAVYIPVMALACWQMRIISPRTVIAAVLGLVTPWWMLLGLGIVPPSDVHLPEIASLLSTIDFNDGMQLATAVLLGAVVFIAAVVLDFFRTMAYNARSRSYNGVIIITGFFTILAMAIDYNNVASYVPVLNMCASLQAAQFFIIHRSDRSWIGIACVLAIYTALYAWTIFA